MIFLKKKQHKAKSTDETKMLINDRLNEDVLAKLKGVSKELKKDERKKQEEEEERQRQKRIEKEKNKSFEELLGESNLDWKSFK